MSRRRRPWLAAALSFVVPGVGQMYCGRPARGVTLLAAALALSPVWVLISLLPVGNATYYALIVGMPAASIVLAFWAAVDAFRLARRVPADAPLRFSQHAAVYLLLLVGGLTASTASTLAIRAWCLHAYLIATPSMAPALHAQDRVLANYLRYHLRDVERGDIVVFHPPGRDRVYVKRVIGLPGERVEIEDGRVFVNGEALPTETSANGDVLETCGSRSYAIEPGGGGRRRFRGALVPDGAYFLLGDNRPSSQDSRQFGPIPRQNILGAVEYRFWAADPQRPRGPLGDR